MEQLPFGTFETSAAMTDCDTSRRAFDPRMRPVYVGLGLCWAILLVVMPMTHMSVDGTLASALLTICGLVLWAAACIRLRGLARVAMGIEAWALLMITCLTSVLVSYVAARAGAPYADRWMETADRMILPGLDWPMTMLSLARHPDAIHLANRAYASLQWQGSLLILLCCAVGKTDRCADFILRWMIGLALACLIFAFLPCLGPYGIYQIPHAEVPAVGSNVGWRQPELLAWLRSDKFVHIDAARLDGIVEFPSFHTIAAILFAWGFWAIRWVRWPMLALNLAMIAASVPIGGHYYIDVVAGAIVAVVAIKAPDWIVSLRAR